MTPALKTNCLWESGTELLASQGPGAKEKERHRARVGEEGPASRGSTEGEQWVLSACLCQEGAVRGPLLPPAPAHVSVTVPQALKRDEQER